MIQYHEGFLSADRRNNMALDIKASRLYELAQMGLCQLFQQKIVTEWGETRFRYFYKETRK